MSASSRTAGAESELAETKKTEKYSKLGQHYIFVPTACLFLFETFGASGTEADEVMADIDKKIAASSGEPWSLALRQRINA